VGRSGAEAADGAGFGGVTTRDPSASPRALHERLRLIVITDRGLAAPRPVEEVVEEALGAGAPAVQLREKEWGAGRTLDLALKLRKLCTRYGALFLVNDRFDLALASGADGVHLGPDDIPVNEVRRVAPPGFLLGWSTDDPEEARRARDEGADYLGCGTVWPTSSKTDAGEAIGPEGLARVVRAVEIPVVGIGGITPENVGKLERSGAAGVAVMGSVMGATDPGGAVRRLLDGLSGG
jgi:thiamine-phosphate diphosphorylase